MKEVEITLEELIPQLRELIEDSRGLYVEVIASALIDLKENPELSIYEALNNAYFDWIK